MSHKLTILMRHNMSSSPITTSEKKPLYEASTQFKNWRFSAEQLTHIRNSLNQAAVAVIRNTFEADEVASPNHYPDIPLRH